MSGARHFGFDNAFAHFASFGFSGATGILPYLRNRA